MRPIPPKKNTAKPTRPARRREWDEAQDIEDAAILGGSAMASMEPFGPVIGAVTGATEEGLALLKQKKPHK